jgi:hypothetical protein
MSFAADDLVDSAIRKLREAKEEGDRRGVFAGPSVTLTYDEARALYALVYDLSPEGERDEPEPRVFDWRVKIEPVGAGDRCTLEVLRGDADTAKEALETWAETIRSTGIIPDSLDVRSTPGCAITGSVGRLWKRYRIRCDLYESETSDGGGWLFVEAEPEEDADAGIPAQVRAGHRQLDP